MKKTLLLVLAILLVPVSANAHAGVVSTNPTQGQVLTSMPTELSVTFSENLLELTNQEVNTLKLSNFDGPEVELGAVKVDGATLSATVPVIDYPSGTYEMVYRVVSADGHEVSDSLTFSLNTPTLYQEQPVEATSVEDTSGVIPLPIALAIAAVIALGGYLIFTRRRNNR